MGTADSLQLVTVEPLVTGISPLAVATYLLARDASRDDSDVTQMKLHKLLYFAQANYLASTGQRLFDAHIEAFEHGPVVESIRRHYEQFGRRIIVVADASQSRNGEQELPENIANYLDAIWSQFGEQSASQLRALSHKDKPWSDNYHPGRLHSIIPDYEMRTWYANLDDQRRVELDTVYMGSFEPFTEEEEKRILAAWAEG
ncbi:Panacea domain-containing protein [Rothia nasimurium]|uniref:Panacea domain-containing protein n=1 Tax=Rothia nasimurium TaxID=85336 RepID=UPI001F32626A|nr:type II toxin-antitoxin system antitoxin SocA domain-containing protein [Rothia nasimurium]